MDSIDDFLERRIERILPDQEIPVDLVAICAHLGATLEEREMIPEAAMRVTHGRFHIYLQSNFCDLPGANLRRRFSLAHEIGHTLFYDIQNGEIKPRKDSPRGDNLEAACHKAASMILIPTRVIDRELRSHPPANAPALMALANRFEVSAEVLLRRLHGLRVFERDWVPVLTRKHNHRMTIEFAPYPPWLRSRLTPPKRGMPFSEWFNGNEQTDGKSIRATDGGVLEASPITLTRSTVIFEVRLKV